MSLPKLPEKLGKIFPIVLILAFAAVPVVAQTPASTATPPAAAAPVAADAAAPAAAPAVQSPTPQAPTPQAPTAGTPVADGAAGASPAPSADDKPVAGTGSSLIPHDLSPYGMFMNADVIVKAVMVGLGFASLVTWTILLVKTIELFAARRGAGSALAEIAGAGSLREASGRFTESKAPVARLVQAALDEEERSYGLPAEGVKERAAALLSRIETRAGRAMGRGTGLLATIGSTAPFVGLFGTVWGIMNSVHRHLEDEHDQPRRGGAWHRRGPAGHRVRPRRGDPRRHHLQPLRARHHRVSGGAGPMPRRRSLRLLSRDLDRAGAGATGPPDRPRGGRVIRWSRGSRARRATADDLVETHEINVTPFIRRDPGASHHLHGGGAAVDGRRQRRPAGLDGEHRCRAPRSRSS